MTQLLLLLAGLVLSAAVEARPFGLGGGVDPNYATTLTATDQTDQRIFQVAAGTTTKAVPFSLSYSGATPSTVEVKIVFSADGVLAQDWTALSGCTIPGSPGAITGCTGLINQGGKYNFRLRAKIAGVVSSADTATSANAWGVGYVLLAIGQSNMARMFCITATAPATQDALTSFYGGQNPGGDSCGSTGWQAVPAFDGVRTWLNALAVRTLAAGLGAAGRGIPFAILNDSKGATNSSAWTSTAGGTLGGKTVADIASAGGDVGAVFWHQGEFDAAGGFTGATTKANYDLIYAWVRTATGRSAAQLPWFQAILGTIGTGSSSSSATNVTRQAQLEWIAATTGALYAGSSIDLARTDDYHYLNGTAYGHLGYRYAQAFLQYLGSASPAYTAKGPIVGTPTCSGSTITVPVTQEGGSALKTVNGATTGIGTQAAWQTTDSNSRTVSSTAFSGGNVVLTMSGTVGTTPTLAYFNAGNPFGGTNTTTSGLIVDDATPQGDTLGLPLLPTTGFISLAPCS